MTPQCRRVTVAITDRGIWVAQPAKKPATKRATEAKVTGLETKRGRPPSTDKLDPFTAHDPKAYDEHEFYTRTTDGHGHSENHQVRLPPDVSSEVAGLVQSKRVPKYGTAQAFIRDAVIHRLYYIAYRLDDRDLKRAVAIQINLARVENKREEIKSMARTVDEYKALYDEAREAQDWDMMGRAIDEADDIMEYMRDPYRRTLRALVRAARKALMDNTKSK